jgi:hypothetical protein
VLIALYSVAATMNYASFVGRGLRQGKGRPVRLALHSPGVRDSARVNGTLLGTTSRFIFVYEAADSTTDVIPIESLTDMVVDRRPRAPLTPPTPRRKVAAAKTNP